MYAVTVTFTLRPGAREAFLQHMLANARASRKLEPGCRQFDVCSDPAAPETVFLYELYDDEDAFHTHLASDHFRLFDRTTAPMVASKTARAFSEVVQ